MSDDGAQTESVESALDRLEAEGARSYDAAACDCVRALLTRAEQLGGAVGRILEGRARSHVESLRERLLRDRARVAAQVMVLEARHGQQPELTKALARGDVTRVARTARRLARRPVVRLRPLTAGDEAVAPAPTAVAPQERKEARKKRSLAYEDSVAELVASIALARASDVVPEDAGPYNALRIASDALDRMRELSPFYLTVQLNRLEELATLLALPELPSKAPEPPPPKKKRGGAKA